MTELLIAVFGTITAYFTYRGAAHSKATRRDIKTNHGTTTGSKIERLVENSEAQGVRLTALEKQLSAHTAQDAENFSSLTRLVAER